MTTVNGKKPKFPSPEPRSAGAAAEPSFRVLVLDWVERIPAGQVATYGQLAILAGAPRAGRQAGWAVARPPRSRDDLPFHRVVSRDGRLAPPDVFGGPGNQRRMLEREGVAFLPNGRVDLDQCRFRPLVRPGPEPPVNDRKCEKL